MCISSTVNGRAAVLPDGRVVTGSVGGGRVLVWDPDEPGAGPVELGRHEGAVAAAAVLPDGRVVTGGGLRHLVPETSSLSGI